MNNFRCAAMAAAIALSVGLLNGCATSATPGAKDARIPAAQNYDVKIQPARIPPNPQGAFALSTATGCDVIYIAKAAAADTVTYAVRPTSRVPQASQCSVRLAQQPGVEGVSAVR
jgi:hypothetical protein